MPDIFSAGAGIISGVLGSLIGGGQRRKARRALANMQYPDEQLPEEYNKNQQLAEEMAATGMPSEQYNQAMRNIQRQQLMALRGANDRRGGLMAIGGIEQAGNDALLNLDTENAKQRILNKVRLMGVNDEVGGIKRDLFDKNVRDKYNRDYNYNMNLLGYGNQNLFGGLDKGIAGLGELGSALFSKGKKGQSELALSGGGY